MIIKCKMCGGDLNIQEGNPICECEFCGTQQTVPHTDDEKKANLFNRANHFRRQNDFDKAIAAYERILEEDDTDAEAHWGVVLSKFGIEYVEDPSTKRQVPTCHRVQVESVLTDADYLATLENALDQKSRNLYEEQAKEISEIQKKILAISANEDPYDVFICYKETDENGKRTKDSALAQEIYYGLTEQGYKVFFSRITLEDKLGQEYEPYIFAALNSANVMIVVGTKPEYFNSVWVKNEWSRYLHLMKNDRGRLLIPCYRDMDPYDLPDDLSNLQSQDMSKIGFMQDLLRGIKKVFNKSETEAKSVQPQQVVVQETKGAVESLLERAYLALEAGQFDRADEFCEQVLNLDAHNVEAYVGKLMAERKTRKKEDLAKQLKPLDQSLSYQHAVRFADAEQKKKLEHWNDLTNQNRRNAEQKSRLERAKQALDKAKSEKDCDKVKEELQLLENDTKVTSLIAACDRKKQEIRDAHYQNALSQKEKGNWAAAINELKQIPGYKDSDDLLKKYQEELQAEEERKEQKRSADERAAAEKKAKGKKKILLGTGAVALVIAVVLIVTLVIIPNARWNKAVSLVEAGQWDEAVEAFKTFGYTEKTAKGIAATRYKEGVAKREAQDWDGAVKAFEEADRHDKSLNAYDEISATYTAKGNALREQKNWIGAQAAYSMARNTKEEAITYYQEGMAEREEQNWDAAINAFKNSKGKAFYVDDYSNDAENQILVTYYEKAKTLREAQDWDGAVGAFTEAGDYSDASTQVFETRYQQGLTLRASQNWDGAVAAFTEAGNYNDAETQIKETRYLQAKKLMDSGANKGAALILTEIKGYKDTDALLSNELSSTIHDMKVQSYNTVGATVTFGQYEQDNDTINGTEPIEWTVLDVRDNKSLLISVYVLDAGPHYSNERGPDNYSWEDSELRDWLNNEFLGKAFSTKEQSSIVLAELITKGQFSFSEDLITKDKVFLLSKEEAEQYFDFKDDFLGFEDKEQKSEDTMIKQKPIAVATNFATAKGAINNNTSKGSSWWLRSVGDHSFNAAEIDNWGRMNDSIATYEHNGIRPAIWVDIESAVAE